jgi:hypothetical protein
MKTIRFVLAGIVRQFGSTAVLVVLCTSAALLLHGCAAYTDFYYNLPGEHRPQVELSDCVDFDRNSTGCAIYEPAPFGNGQYDRVRVLARDYCEHKNLGPPDIRKTGTSAHGSIYDSNAYRFTCGTPKSGLGPTEGMPPTLSSAQPTYGSGQGAYQPVQPAVGSSQPFSKNTSSGSAPCSIGDGYQTVRFSDGAVYSGSFRNCRPLAGPAQYQQGSTVLTGYAEPVDDRTVKLRSGNSIATITLQIESVRH